MTEKNLKKITTSEFNEKYIIKEERRQVMKLASHSGTLKHESVETERINFMKILDRRTEEELYYFNGYDRGDGCFMHSIKYFLEDRGLYLV